MHERAIHVSNEVELAEVISILEAHSIDYRIHDESSTAFPSIKGDRSIMISEVDYPLFAKNININFRTSKIARTQMRKNGMDLRVLALIVYSIIMTFMFLKYYDYYRKMNYDKNTYYELDSSNNLILKDKSTNLLLQKFIDRNFDENFEKVIGYAKSKKIIESIDENENGHYENHVYFGLDGEIIGTAIDVDEDGLLDESTNVLEDGRTIIFVDKNKNGKYEMEERY